MTFETDRLAKFAFVTDQDTPSKKMTLNGINATLGSADSICAGVTALLTIGGNTPYYDGEAKRTVTQVVYNY